MNLLISDSRKQLHSRRKVVSDKPSVCGTLFNMPTGIYNRKTSPLCNQCGLSPKYPSQGLCKKCYFEKAHKKWVDNRPEKLLIPDLDGEIWNDIDNAPGYQVSNLGRIKSLNRYDESGRHHILKLREARKGSYLKADLDKYNWRPSVHRLVAIHFIPNPENHPHVLHKDSNKQNNVVDNLYWGTISQNRADYINHTNKNGIVRKKLSKQAVLEIYSSQDTVQQLSIDFKVEASTIWMIKNGYRWSTVTGHICTDKRKLK